MDKQVKGYLRVSMIAAGLAASFGLIFSAPSAMAHEHVDLSIGVGVGAPPVVYQQPAVVYAQSPVVYERVPVVEYRDPYRWHHEHEWREHERREHEWREHERHEHEWHDRHDGGEHRYYRH